MAMSDELPKRTTNLNTIPKEYRIAYLPAGSGGQYELCDAVAAVVDEGLATLAKMRSDHEADMAASAKEIEGWHQERHKSTVRNALLHELAEAGVTGGLAKGAAAIIESTHKLVVEDHGLGPVVLAETPYGPFSAQHLVADFLRSDGGEPYRSKRTTPNAGHFASMVADMKRGR